MMHHDGPWLRFAPASGTFWGGPNNVPKPPPSHAVTRVEHLFPPRDQGREDGMSEDERIDNLERWMESTEERLASMYDCLRSIAAVIEAHSPARPTRDR